MGLRDCVQLYYCDYFQPAYLWRRVALAGCEASCRADASAAAAPCASATVERGLWLEEPCVKPLPFAEAAL